MSEHSSLFSNNSTDLKSVDRKQVDFWEFIWVQVRSIWGRRKNEGIKDTYQVG